MKREVYVLGGSLYVCNQPFRSVFRIVDVASAQRIAIKYGWDNSMFYLAEVTVDGVTHKALKFVQRNS